MALAPQRSIRAVTTFIPEEHWYYSIKPPTTSMPRKVIFRAGNIASLAQRLRQHTNTYSQHEIDRTTAVTVKGNSTWLSEYRLTLIERIIEHFPNCAELLLQKLSFDDVERWNPHTRMDSMVSITFNRVNFSTPHMDLCDLVSLLPQLQNLEVLDSHWSDIGFYHVGINPPRTQLRSLQIGPIEDHHLWRVERLLRGCNETITQLHIDLESDDESCQYSLYINTHGISLIWPFSQPWT